MDMTESELCEAMGVIGVVPTDIMVVKRAQTYTEAVELLRLLKDKARRGFRAASKVLHPDVNGGDEGKTKLFMRAKEVAEHIQAARIQPPPPPVQRVYIHMYGPPFASTYTSTSTATWPGTTTYVVYR